MRNVQFLCLRVINEQEHRNILVRDKQWWFPILRTDEKHWLDLALQPIFMHMKTEELIRQMRLLLSMLLSISNDGLISGLKSRLIGSDQAFTGFSPLQNLSLICEAFRVPMNHLNLFGTFNWTEFSPDLSLSKLFGKIDIIGPEALQQRWTTLSQHLPIDYPLNGLVSRSRASELNKY